MWAKRSAAPTQAQRGFCDASRNDSCGCENRREGVERQNVAGSDVHSREDCRGEVDEPGHQARRLVRGPLREAAE